MLLWRQIRIFANKGIAKKRAPRVDLLLPIANWTVGTGSQNPEVRFDSANE